MSETARKAISEKDLAVLKESIAAAEKLTSGEIRLFIEDHSEDDPLDRAAFLFSELGMDKTELRNGVLIYLAFSDRKFSIIGDYGIHEKVGDSFWNGTRDKMTAEFRQGKIVEGLKAGILSAGDALGKYFPYKGGDINELPDDVVFGKGEE